MLPYVCSLSLCVSTQGSRIPIKFVGDLMTTITAVASGTVKFFLTCAPSKEPVYGRCKFVRTTAWDSTRPELRTPVRDPAEVAAARATLQAHLTRVQGGAPCCADKALHCAVCELYSLMAAEATMLLRSAAHDHTLFEVKLRRGDNRPKLWACSGKRSCKSYWPP